MASKRIPYSTASIGGAMAVTTIQALDASLAAVQKLVTLANEVTGDGGVSTNLLENSPEFGVAAGQGAAFYTAFNTILATLNTTALKNYIADLRQTS